MLLNMRQKGYKHSEETKRKLSLSKIGNKNPQFGIHRTKEEKEHLRKMNIGRKFTDEVRLKISIANKGRKHTDEARKNMSDAHKGQKAWNSGKTGVYSEETRRKIGDSQRGKKRGPMNIDTRKKMSEYHLSLKEKSWNWKGGTSPEKKIIRKGLQFKLWREAVFVRDNWTCQKYNTKGGTLHPHHIQNFSDFPELRFEVSNGITLSEKAHREFHKKYGLKNNTYDQLQEFISSVKAMELYANSRS
jgi:hypothetical protein